MEIIYQVIKSELGEYVQATDADSNVYAIPTDPANSDYQQYLVWLEAQTPKTTSK